jgi:hypothetical protein
MTMRPVPRVRGAGRACSPCQVKPRWRRRSKLEDLASMERTRCRIRND